MTYNVFGGTLSLTQSINHISFSKSLEIFWSLSSSIGIGAVDSLGRFISETTCVECNVNPY